MSSGTASRVLPLVFSLCMLLSSVPADAQRYRDHARPRRPGAVVFVGGYFYDPFFGPYPWWLPAVYPHAYFPVFDDRGEIRLQVRPREAAVYVDGYYAGVVDDFDGVFQRLKLEAGAHRLEVRAPGFRPLVFDVLVTPGETTTYRGDLKRQ